MKYVIETEKSVKIRSYSNVAKIKCQMKKTIFEFYSQIEILKILPMILVLEVHDVFDSRLSNSWFLE